MKKVKLIENDYPLVGRKKEKQKEKKLYVIKSQYMIYNTDYVKAYSLSEAREKAYADSDDVETGDEEPGRARITSVKLYVH